VYGSVLSRVVLRRGVNIGDTIRSAVCSGTVQLGRLIILYTMSSWVLRIVSGTDSGHVHSCVRSRSIQLWWICRVDMHWCMCCR
jgi:hypothetical protein